MEEIIGLKEFRQNIEECAKAVQAGNDFIVVRRSKPLFKVTFPRVSKEEEEWEEVADFTKIRRGGINLKEILARL